MVCDGIIADLDASIGCSETVLRFLRVVLAEVCSGISFRLYVLVNIWFACRPATCRCGLWRTNVFGCGWRVRLDVSPSLVVSAVSLALRRSTRSGIAVAAELTVGTALLRLSIRHCCGQSPRHSKIA